VKADLFCSTSAKALREAAADYFVSDR
jgi:hypothetical protein